MNLSEIAGVIGHADHTVTITWSDGMSAVVDFLPIIDRGGWFTPLREGNYFVTKMIILPAAAGLTWLEEIDYSADFLRLVAFPHRSPAER
jgi:hypothetical protein